MAQCCGVVVRIIPSVRPGPAQFDSPQDIGMKSAAGRNRWRYQEACCGGIILGALWRWMPRGELACRRFACGAFDQTTRSNPGSGGCGYSIEGAKGAMKYRGGQPMRAPLSAFSSGHCRGFNTSLARMRTTFLRMIFPGKDLEKFESPRSACVFDRCYVGFQGEFWG